MQRGCVKLTCPKSAGWLGSLVLSKATCVVTVTMVFSPTGGDISYPERGICVGKGSLEEVLLWELYRPMISYLRIPIALLFALTALRALRAPKSWPQHGKLLEQCAR